MATTPDDLVVTGPVLQQKTADTLYVTPSGGTQGQLQNLVNGGTNGANPVLLQFQSITPAGTALANATPIISENTLLGTAASTTGVSLPLSTTTVGYPLLVVNAGTAAVHVYGTGGDVIDTIAGTTGVTLTNGFGVTFLATAANVYHSTMRGTIAS